jgi:hypothetical protein
LHVRPVQSRIGGDALDSIYIHKITCIIADLCR